MHTKAPTIRMLTLGCAKNRVDSEVLFSQLHAQGFSVEHSEDKVEATDTLIINTCGFIEEAKQQSIDIILQAAHAKQQGHIQRLFVIGCLSARYKESLQAEIPEVDAYFGTQSWPEILRALGAPYRESLLSERHSSTPAHYAYLKISEGCNRPCAFCAIPSMRGQHRSRPMEELLKEARTLAQRGVKELVLIAQDSTYYGLDLYGKRMLAPLMDRLADIEGLSWIRLHYAYPNGFPLDVLRVMADRDNICKYLDMPLQHASPTVLRRMRRPMSSDALHKLLDTIRDRVPGIALRTTFIVGFPGETAADFEELLAFIKAQSFARVGAFTYSHEEGTAAYALYRDDVPATLKKQRYDQLMALQKPISLAQNKARVGKKLYIMIEKPHQDGYIGRSAHDSPEVDNQVWVQSPRPLAPGALVQVHIQRASAYDLYGKACLQ